jgi:ferric citrate transport system permease protein
MNNKQKFMLKRNFHPNFILIALLIIILILSIVSLGLGAIYITPSEIIQNLMGEGTQSQTFILHNYRIPRILIAIIVGAGLATAGAILQGVLRNPLASPDVIGVTKGAGLAAVIIIVLFPMSPIPNVTYYFSSPFRFYWSSYYCYDFDVICLQKRCST